MQKLISIFRKGDIFYPLTIILIAAVISVANFTPNTYLSGWDTLHPEFNYSLNLVRTFFGVFREEQGLGALAAHAHMVELPRIIQLIFYDIFLPQNAVRYAYIFSNLVLGPLGMYFFLKNIVIKKKLPSFLGALFYLLNLGTYQTFLVPFEMFTTLYAAIPWVFLTLHNILDKFSKRNLFLLSLALVFAIPSAYASSLWFVFIMVVGIYFSAFILTQKEKIKLFKRFFAALVIIFAINSYWLLPNLYFALNDAKSVTNANINLLFSEGAFLKNKEFGTWDNILSLKTFYFDWGIYDYKTQSFIQLTSAFQTHLENFFIKSIGILSSIFFLAGIVLSIKYFKKFSTALIAVLLFSLIFLVNDNPPLSPVFNFLQENVPLFKEALRFPNNKILNIFTFIFAIYFAFSMDTIFKLIRRFELSKIFTKAFAIVISTLLAIFMLPVFTGNLINPNMRVSIPDEYFQMFSYMQTQGTGRVANFPVHSPWGWTYHEWHEGKPSFQGAGFLYFGIPQSLLERDFDRWNPHNEQYYREISHAVYSKNPEHLKEVIRKYDITHLLVDESIIAAGNDPKVLYYKELKEMLESFIADGFIDESKKFGNFLSVYSIKNINTSVVSSLPISVKGNVYEGSIIRDSIFSQYGDYTSGLDTNGISYPLNSLFNNEYKVNKNSFALNSSNLKFNLDNKYALGNSPFMHDSMPASIITSLGGGFISLSLYPVTPQFDGESLLQPISGQFSSENKATAILTVNNSAFPLNKLSENTPLVIGSTFLSTTNNNLALFDTNSEPHNYIVADIPFTFTRCNNAGTTRSAFIRPDALNFEGNSNEDLCVHAPLYFIDSSISDSQNVLLEISYVTNNSSFTACLADMNSQCLINLPKENLGSLTKFYVALNKSDLNKRQIILTTKGVSAHEINMENVSFSIYEPESESVLGPSYFNVNLPAEKFSTVTIPAQVNSSHSFVPSENENLDNKCTETNPATKELIDENGVKRFVYKSGGGSFCDSVSFETLPHSLSYFVFVRSKNIEGLPMTVCLTNYESRRCDIYSKLSDSDSINEDVFFLPATASGQGYDVNIENIGLPKTPGINELYSIRFIPVPFSLLSQINSGEAEKLTYSGKIAKLSNFNDSQIVFEIEGESALVELNAPHNNGFKLYEINCDGQFSCFINSFFAPIIGTEVNSKGISNGWNNVWEAKNNGKKFAIVFLPQYLQYSGYILFAISLLSILVGNKFSFISRRLKQTNSFFEAKTDNLKGKIYEAKGLTRPVTTPFPYSIDLSDKRRFWQN